MYRVQATSWIDAPGGGGAWRTTTVEVTARGVELSADGKRRTVSFRDVVRVAKDASYWVVPDAVTLTLGNGRVEHIAGLPHQHDAFLVLSHFWHGWWATVNALKTGHEAGMHAAPRLSGAVLAPEMANALRRLDEAAAAGADAARELARQTEQLERIYSGTVEVNHNLGVTQRLLDSMSSWWYVPMTTASAAPSSKGAASAATAAPAVTKTPGPRDPPGWAMYAAEKRGEYAALRIDEAGHYRACTLRCGNGGVRLHDEERQKNETVPLASVASVACDLDRCRLVIRDRGGVTHELLSARLSVLAAHVHRWLPDAGSAGAQLSKTSAHKAWGAAAAEVDEAVVRPVAVTWLRVDGPARPASAASESTGSGGMQAQLRATEQLPGTDAFLDEVSAQVSRLGQLATALNTTLVSNDELLDRIERQVDQADAALHKQTRQAVRITKAL